MDLLDLLAVQGTLKSLLQHHSSKAWILRCSGFFTVQLSHPYMTTGTSLNIRKFMVHILLKPGLENLEHYFTSMWDEWNYALVRACFGIAFLWDWNKNWPFPVLWPLLRFPICWHIEGSTFTASSFRIWNSSTGIPSLQLAFFIVMLSKAHLTLHSRMSGSRWVITPPWSDMHTCLCPCLP